ncbi:MAG TPA: hypothetical protein DDY13_20400 [Cytophagales bacterium]|jgi:protein CpxP|nr:hypothetical protein [Cytophagales bacterium]
MRKYITIILIGLLVLINIFLLFTILKDKKVKQAFDRPPVCDDVPHMARRLHFDDKQLLELREIRSDHFATIQDIHNNMDSVRLLISGELINASYDQARIDSLTARLGKLHADFEYVTFQHFRDIRDICKDGQKGQFDTLARRVMRFKHENRPGQHRMHRRKCGGRNRR